MDGGESKERVLVVDDEPQILVALEDLLGDDFTILKSTTPEGALKTIEADPNIAVVVTDQRMPRMTGDELLARMTGASAVGIMVSGFADLPAVIRAINEGKVFAYVTKPWNPEDLRFKVSKGVEHFRLARQIAHERQLLADLMNSSPDGIFFKDCAMASYPSSWPCASRPKSRSSCAWVSLFSTWCASTVASTPKNGIRKAKHRYVVRTARSKASSPSRAT
jgi:CheY-like chemotaxis protein